MLHQIAEREVQRRVIARVGEDNVVLRQLDEGETADDEAAAARHQARRPKAEEGARTRRQEGRGQGPGDVRRRRRRVVDTAPAASVPAPAGESIAAKMSRIRAAVARSRATDAFSEDEAAEAMFPPIETAFADVTDVPHAPVADENPVVEDEAFEDAGVAEAEAEHPADADALMSAFEEDALVQDPAEAHDETAAADAPVEDLTEAAFATEEPSVEDETEAPMAADEAPVEDLAEEAMFADEAPAEDEAEAPMAADEAPVENLAEEALFADEAPVEDEAEDWMAADAPDEDLTEAFAAGEAPVEADDLVAADAPAEDLADAFFAEQAPDEDEADAPVEELTGEAFATEQAFVEDEADELMADDDAMVEDLDGEEAFADDAPVEAEVEELMAFDAPDHDTTEDAIVVEEAPVEVEDLMAADDADTEDLVEEAHFADEAPVEDEAVEDDAVEAMTADDAGVEDVAEAAFAAEGTPAEAEEPAAADEAPVEILIEETFTYEASVEVTVESMADDEAPVEDDAEVANFADEDPVEDAPVEAETFAKPADAAPEVRPAVDHDVASVLARLRSAVQSAVGRKAAEAAPGPAAADDDAAEVVSAADMPASADPAPAPRLVRARVVKMKKSDFDRGVQPDADLDDEAAVEPDETATAARRNDLAALAAAVAAFASDKRDDDVTPAPHAATDDADDDADDEDSLVAAGADEPADDDGINLFDEADEDDDDAWGDDAVAAGDDAEVAADVGSSLSDDEEAELLQELAALEAEIEAPKSAREGKAIFEGPRGAETSVTRILKETESQLDDTDASRRRSTIAHLKAAVAATRAEGDDGPEDDEDDMDAYRDDLERVVRPRRPADGRGAGPAARRMAPLMLVSEQRIDLPSDSGKVDVSPRRITTGNLALKHDDRDDEADEDDGAEADGLFADGTSFAVYARKMGATDLPDLLEAAAAYAAYVEGRPHFSRPQLMKQVATFGDGDFSREDGLRSFGTLLRQGKIQKLKRGQFTIAKSSRFRPESFHA